MLARSAFDHSVNYRSVVILGRAFEVEDEAEKVRALKAIVEHVAPSRWEEVRGPSPSELRQTTVLGIGLDDASAKVRSGPPKDDEEDLVLPVWAGELPMRLVALEPRDDPLLRPGIGRPAWLDTYDRGAKSGRKVSRRGTGGEEGTPGSLDYDGLIVDLDGVVWLGGEPIEGAAGAIAALRANGTRVVFVTNDPQSSGEEQAARLAAIGIPATAADVLTAATATARFLESRGNLAGRHAFVIGSPALRREIEQAGLRLVSAPDAGRAEVVVVGGHDRFDYDELRSATTAILNGAALYATARDAVFPAHDGPRPATGAILAAVEAATGATATVVGKPGPLMFQIARDALAGCRRVAVVGDHLISDVAGAKGAGLDAILVLTGTSSRDDLEEATIQPDLVLPSIAALPGLRG